MTDYFFGTFAGIVAVLLSIYLGDFEHEHLGQIKKAIQQCEIDLPRNIECVAVITARVAQPPSGE